MKIQNRKKHTNAKNLNKPYMICGAVITYAVAATADAIAARFLEQILHICAYKFLIFRVRSFSWSVDRSVLTSVHVCSFWIASIFFSSSFYSSLVRWLYGCVRFVYTIYKRPRADRFCCCHLLVFFGMGMQFELSQAIGLKLNIMLGTAYGPWIRYSHTRTP